MSGDSTVTRGASTGGDAVYDEVLGSGTKMPASKLHLGAIGVDGGPVTTAAPLPRREHDGTNPTFPTGSAAADGGASGTVTRWLARATGYNGSTWDMLRAGLVAATSSFAGYLNAIPFALFKATRPALTNGQGLPVEVTPAGDLTMVAGAVTNTTYLTADIDPNGVVVLTGPSIVYAVAVNQSSGGTLFAFLYDATSTQPVNAKPLINAGSVGNNASVILTVGPPSHGLPFVNGVVLQLSAVASQFSPSGSTLARGYIIHT